MTLILVSDDFSGYVYIDDAELQAIGDAVERMAEAIGQLIAGGSIKRMEEMNMDKRTEKPDCANCWKLAVCVQATPGTGFCAAYQEKQPKRDPADNPAEKWSRGDEMD